MTSFSRADLVIWPAVLVLANIRALQVSTLYPDPSVRCGLAWIEIALWGLTALVVLCILRQKDLAGAYVALWRRNWLLGLFVLLALLSVSWSLAPRVTVFRALELLLATLIASYLGLRCRPAQLMAVLSWFGAIFLLLSSGAALAFPKIGQMYSRPEYRSWRGVYWNKNHLGTIAALVGIVFLCRMAIGFGRRRRVPPIDSFFYCLSLVVLALSHSATGGIVAVVLHALLLCIGLWISTAHRRRSWHYYAAAAVIVSGLSWTMFNLDHVFGLFNRSALMSGRVALWKHLLRDVVPQHPWWGHGFGAIWTFESFRVATQQHIGWGHPVLIADDGFLDILLHVGVVGLLGLVSILIVGSVRACRYARAGRTLPDFLPLVVMVYALVSNVAFSLLAETELLVWVLIVIVLFLPTPLPRKLRTATCQ